VQANNLGQADRQLANLLSLAPISVLSFTSSKNFREILSSSISDFNAMIFIQETRKMRINIEYCMDVSLRQGTRTEHIEMI